MSAFSDKSVANMIGLHPVLQTFFREITEHFDCAILPGSVRTLEQQTYNVAHGLSETMDSKHLMQPDGFSHAVDAACTPQEWENSPPAKLTKYEAQLLYFGGFVMGFAAARPELLGDFKLRYGGDWNQNDLTQDNRFNDLDHFELVSK